MMLKSLEIPKRAEEPSKGKNASEKKETEEEETEEVSPAFEETDNIRVY